MAVCVGLIAGCYEGPGPAEPPPGSPGGLCYKDTLSCDLAYACDQVGKYCYDTQDPCRGVFCSEHGTCAVEADSDRPTCMCEQGFSNYRYTLLCEAV